MKRFEDLTGKKFGRWTVIRLERTEAVKSKRQTTNFRHWLCVCDCGTYKTVRGPALRKGHSKSCGCLCAEVRSSYTKSKKLSKEGTPFRRLLASYKNSAKKRNILWELNDDTFKALTQLPCYFTGRKPSSVMRTSFEEYVYNGVDRLDSNKGYTQENCVPCCGEVNIMKNTLSKDNFIDLCKMIAERF